MLSWSELSKLLERTKGVTLKDHVLQTTPSEIPHYPITATAATAATATAVPAATAEVLAPAPAPAPAAPVLPFREEYVAPQAPKVRELVPAKHTIDPIVLGLSLFDPLYEGSPHTTRHKIEIEAAIKLESELDTLYKTNSGRSRGWTKVGLEGMLKPRCASGGDLKELDHAKKPFLWSVVHEEKTLSAFLDFVCCARRIHTVVMDNEKRTAYLYPAADILNPDDAVVTKKTAYPLFAVNTTGHPLYGLSSSSDLLTYIDTHKWKLMPPHSVVHSLSGLKLDELESVGKRLGMPVVEGSKSERVAAIAEYKTRARLLV